MKKLVCIISVMCFGYVPFAHSASSLRVFGGANTVTTKSVESPSVARAAAVKSGTGMIKMSGTKTNVNSTVGTATAKNVKSSYADTERLAVSKIKSYNRNNNTSSGSSEISSADFSALQNTVSGLQTQLNTLSDSVSNKANTDALDDLQDALDEFEDRLDDSSSTVSVSSGDNYINVDATGKITINAENLKTGLGVQNGTDAREVAMRNKDGKIQWRYTTGDDVKWKNLVDMETTVESAVANLDITDIAENNTGELENNAYVYVLAYDPTTQQVDWVPVNITED